MTDASGPVRLATKRRESGHETDSAASRIARCMRVLATHGQLVCGGGHVSARLGHDGAIAIIGHLHVLDHDVEEIGAVHVITVDPHGMRLSGELDPPDEVHLHCELFRARPDVDAIAHTHSDHVVAVAAAGLDLTPVDRRTARFAPRVPVMETPSSLSIATPQAGKTLAAALGHHDVVVLAGHGAVAVGRTPEAATVAALDLDRLAHIRLAMGTAVSERAAIHRTDVDASYVNEAIEIGWRYWSHGVE